MRSITSSLWNSGGANDIKNLWPEPYALAVKGETLGARQKDVVETQ